MDTPRDAETPVDILLVDDSADISRSLSDLLRHAGYSVESVRSGETALVYLSARPAPGLVLLDVRLPGLSGFDVLRRIRANAATAGLPVVMFSFLGDQEIVDVAAKLGASDYWVKVSMGVDLLCGMIRKHLSR